MRISNRDLHHTEKRAGRNLHLKVTTMLDPITGLFEIMQYKKGIAIVNLVEPTWLSRYPRPLEIKHGQRSEFIGH